MLRLRKFSNNFMIDLKQLSIKKASEMLLKKEITAKALAEAYLAVIAVRNKNINAYLEVYDDVLAQAEAADKLIASGKGGPLTGIPLAIKDNILIKGRRASSASKILEHYKATYDATVITKLKAAGVVFLGRTNMDEFAMGGSTENSAYGVTKNPIDETRVSGGSSGGSAAVVAMDGALASLGSDTGGSVRQPASFCGVVGLKPTYGAISRHGLMAMGSSLDQIGPITKTVGDSELLFKAMVGKDSFDSTSGTYEMLAQKKTAGKKMVIGVPRAFMKQGGIDSAVLQNFDESIKKLQNLGMEIRDIDLPNIGYSLAVYYIIMPAEASTNLSRFDGVKYGLHKDGNNLLQDYQKTRGQGFGKEVRRRILLGAYVLSSGYYDAYYNKANVVRRLISDDFKKVFESGVDVVITPTTPAPAFIIGEKVNDPVQMYLADIFTVTANIAGIPALSVPSGTVATGGKELPLGLQFMATHGGEDILFSVGKLFLGE